MKIKPHIGYSYRTQVYFVSIAGEVIYVEPTLAGAYLSAFHLWRHQ